MGGKPTLLNLWAYWCAPCAEELPYLQEFAERADGSINVLTRAFGSESGERFDATHRLLGAFARRPGTVTAKVRIAVGAPPVLPVSVLVRADGTVAKVLPQPFRSADEIAAAAAQYLGVVV